MTADVTLTVRSPADLIAAVPYLLGFHPQDSLTVVALRGTRVVFAVRHDLPKPDTPDADARAEARHVAGVIARQDVDGATVVGHGVAGRVTPAVLRLSAALTELGVPVVDELRVTDGRYWSYVCQDPKCCPPEGQVCDPSTTAVAAAATYAGQVALPDRQALAARVEPVTGAARTAMAAATERARHRLADLANGPGLRQARQERAVHRAGRAAVRGAARRCRAGGQLADDEVAWLGVLLTHLPVRDHAWEHTDGADWQVALWSEVLRRVAPEYAPAPACLLAFAAWRGGHGALATIAVQRALAQDPTYSMAALLDEVLQYGLPPSAVDDWPVSGAGGAGGRRARSRRPSARRSLKGR